MTRKAIRAPLALGMAILLLSSCHSQPSSEDIGNQVKNLGVYAFNGAELIELSVYGSEQPGGSFRFREAIPKIPSVRYFVVNIPNSNIGDSNVYLLTDPKVAARWSNEQFAFGRGPAPLKTSVEALRPGVYKVTPVVSPTKQGVSP